MVLPILASPDEAVQVVNFLKTRVTGCTIEDAKAVIDNKLLDSRKINAYIIWQLIIRDGDRLKLSDLGKRLSKASVTSYPEIFASVIKLTHPYYCALEWIFYQKDLTTITNIEVANYWYETKKFSLDSESENTLKDMAVCFFKVCEAAGLGKLTIGRKGQPTRLDVSRESLSQFIAEGSFSQDNPVQDESQNNTSVIIEDLRQPSNRPSSVEVTEQIPNSDFSNAPISSVSQQENTVRIFISHGKNMEIVDQIKTLIDLACFDYEVVVETETSAIPIPEKVFGAMRRCNSAVICVSADENEKKEDGTYGINENVLIEIGSAFVLYDKKVILVWDKRIAIPSNLQGLYRCEYTGDELSWGTGIKLMKALSEFKRCV